MLNFNLVGTIHLLQMLDFYERSPVYSGANEPSTIIGIGRPTPATDISSKDRENGQSIIAAAKKLAAELSLEGAQHRIDLFEIKLQFKITPADYITEIKVLSEALRHDLSKCFFYCYPKAKLDYLMKFYPSWRAAKTAFPLIEPEALAATDCYALGHNVASVFHSMRVAEHGLRALGKERKIQLPKNKPVEWGQWQEIIRELTKEATKIGDKARAGNAKDEALSFYSGAISDLNAFKDEYRNQVMHVRKDYDEHQALRALVKVHAFMERMAAKMDHKHHRIRWGLKFA